MSNSKLYGFWSAEQASVAGYSIYTKPDGSRVKVSMYSAQEGVHNTYWRDIVSVGEIADFLVHVEPEETEGQAFARQEEERKNVPNSTEKMRKIAEEARLFAHSPSLTTHTVFKS